MAKTELQILEVGDLLADKYRLVEEIGRGAMGVVYRANHEGMDREVAVKTLLPQAVAHPRMIARFKQEVRVISHLKHPNTITVFDYGDLPGGLLFFVMEMLEGVPLGTILREEGTLGAERVRKISIQILKSLNEAHSQSIVHRDLKPDNIFICDLLGESDYVKVLDFGIAKALEPDSNQELTELTGTGMSVGTPVYMAPEQIEREDIGPQTDLYGLGCLMYEMLTGRPLFFGKSWIEVALKKLGDTPVLLRHDVVSSELGGVIVKALRREMKDRYQSADEMLRDLVAVGNIEGRAPLKPSKRSKVKSGTPIDAMIVDTPFGPRVVTSPGVVLEDAGPTGPMPEEHTTIDARALLEEGVLSGEVQEIEDEATRVEPSLFETDAPVYGQDSQGVSPVALSDSFEGEAVSAAASRGADSLETPLVVLATGGFGVNDVTHTETGPQQFDSGLRPTVARSDADEEDGTTQVQSPSGPVEVGERLERPQVSEPSESEEEDDLTTEFPEALALELDAQRAAAAVEVSKSTPLVGPKARQVDKHSDGTNMRVVVIALAVVVLFLVATAGILMLVLALYL